MFRQDFIRANEDAIDILKRLQAFVSIDGVISGAALLFRARLKLEYALLEVKTAPIRDFKRWKH